MGLEEILLLSLVVLATARVTLIGNGGNKFVISNMVQVTVVSKLQCEMGSFLNEMLEGHTYMGINQ